MRGSRRTVARGLPVCYRRRRSRWPLLAAGSRRTGAADSAPAAAAPSAAAEKIKIGFITKFPVDFYDIMVDAAKDVGRRPADVEVVFAQGKSGTDDEGEIAAIESMVTQGVEGDRHHADQPERPGRPHKAVDAGIKVVLIDNDIPDWTGKSSVVATDNLAGGKLAGSWLKENLPPAPRSRCSRACSAPRRSTTASTGMLDTPRRRRRRSSAGARPRTATRPRAWMPARTS